MKKSSGCYFLEGFQSGQMIKWHVCFQERTLGVHIKATESALIAYNVTVLMFLVFCVK